MVAGVRRAGLFVIIIDDGSDEPAAAAIAALHDPGSGVRVVRLPVNGGKGVAVMEGFRLAQEAGYTHVVQVDADGQHDLGALTTLLDAARRHPQALVSGAPQYDRSIPWGRRIGRWVTHLWVFLETLSLRISDSMCGFRIYPLAPCMALVETERPGARMDFDTEIMVRLFWRGVAPIMVPVRVVYPADNTSNFDMLWDNLRISRMHARLVVSMLWRLRGIVRNRPPRLDSRPSHWAGLSERGTLWGLRFIAGAYALLGRRACTWVMAPIVLHFFCVGAQQRRASRAYLGQVLDRQPSLAEGLRHFMDFAGAALDAFAAWSGAVRAEAMEVADPDFLARAMADPRGALLVVSHHGSVELARALMDPALRNRLTVLVHTRHARNYNRLLAQYRGAAAVRMIQVSAIGPDTAILLRDCVERGDWVAVAGDRVPLESGRVASAPFLGKPAAFSQGPWLLAALLDCPVHLLFCRRRRPGAWTLMLEPFRDRVVLPRGRREDVLADHIAAYACRLERECREAPWQWYNFFDFWGGGERQ